MARGHTGDRGNLLTLTTAITGAVIFGMLVTTLSAGLFRHILKQGKLRLITRPRTRHC